MARGVPKAGYRITKKRPASGWSPPRDNIVRFPGHIPEPSPAEPQAENAVSWLSEARFVSEQDGRELPKTFEFGGSVIFISNYDFDAMIARGHRLAPHLQIRSAALQFLGADPLKFLGTPVMPG
jgi:hypothetical protein